ELGEPRLHRLAEAVRLQEPPIGVRRGGEAGRHLDAPAAQRTHHLAERGVLAADACDVRSRQILEPEHLRGWRMEGLRSCAHVLPRKVGDNVCAWRPFT